LLASPGFVHWLAKSTRAPVEAIPAQMNILANIAAKEKDEETKKAMGDYMQEATGGIPGVNGAPIQNRNPAIMNSAPQAPRG
jgi:hypothetical protein